MVILYTANRRMSILNTMKCCTKTNALFCVISHTTAKRREKMSKRQTVTVSISAVEELISSKGWSNAQFCTKIMGKSRGWISEWKRNANFPSPEEAAAMCIRFDCKPKDIVLGREDQCLVQELLEAKKGQFTISGKLSDGEQRIIDMIRRLPPEEQEAYPDLLEVSLKARGLL